MPHPSIDLVSKSYSIISGMIFTYELPPGAAVSDFVLSKKIGISRTPIRQAILKLVADGIVVETDNGFHVIEITEEFIHELYEARKCLELAVVPILISKKADLSHLRELCIKEDECLKTGRYIEALANDIDYHNGLVEAAGNGLLIKAYKVMYMRMKLINLLSLVSLNFKTPEMYLEILDNLEHGNIEKTCELLGQQQDLGEKQKIASLRKFGGAGAMNLFNFISGCFVAFDNVKIID